ncbi:MAG TPA: peptidase M48 Ste24p, partial [Sulfitobacter pontiacus]|nr:peptidase M48 Ste24p [Sulfitobacter pontiacus]
NDNLQIGLDSEDIIFWRLGDIRLVPDQARGKDYTLRSVTDPLARLIVADKTLLQHLPAARRPAPARGRGRLFAWAIAAVAAVLLQITVLVPFLADRLANFIPPAGEAALGEATLGQIRRALDESGMQPLAICDASAGEAALTSMITALNTGEGPVQDLTVLVLDHPMVNAFALPGGIVVL